MLFTLLSPFAHENGVLVVPLLGLIELTTPGRAESVWRSARRLLVWLVPVIGWFALWRMVSAIHGANALQLNGVADIGRNILYFAQGAAYPVTWVGGWMRDTLKLNDFLAAAVLGLLGLGLAAAIQLLGRRDRRSWLPWLWLGLTSLPALLFLTHGYLAAAPRTLMLSSAGIAWLWADVFVRLADRARAGLARVGVAALLIGLMWQNTQFIQEQLPLFSDGRFAHPTDRSGDRSGERGRAIGDLYQSAGLVSRAASKLCYRTGRDGARPGSR